MIKSQGPPVSREIGRPFNFAIYRDGFRASYFSFSFHSPRLQVHWERWPSSPLAKIPMSLIFLEQLI